MFGQTPSTEKMSARNLERLYATPDRHPNALGYEMKRAPLDALLALENPDWPSDLAALARAEIERRKTAMAHLLADNPSLRIMLSQVRA